MSLPPAGVTLDEVRETTDRLLKAGATIQELNAVRKHLDRLKGGRLARAAAPARVEALILSDVIGDPLDVIASGPVSPDPTTFSDAVDVLEHRGLWQQVPLAVRSHLGRGLEGAEEETPQEGDACFERVRATVIGNNRLAAEAARGEAERRGYRARLLTTLLTGEAREVGCVLAALGREIRCSGEPFAPPACWVAAGETTVTVVGDGKGGRNQELVLGAALELDGQDGIVVASLGTDGIDGPTDAAGALCDGATPARGRAAGLDARASLARNDAYGYFQALDDLIVTGPTGTNVMDVQVVLVGS
jgi:hydroxypyruvate reductase